MRASAVPAPAAILIASFLCPTEFSLFIAGLRLPPHRIALLVLLPLALARLFASRDIRVRSFDCLFIAFSLWSLTVYALHSGFEGLVYGGSLAVESLGAYLIARAFVRDGEKMLATSQFLMVAITISAAIALPEAILGQILTHDLLAKVTGYVHPIGVEQRMGLTRAYGTFDHPIHFGTFCAGLLAVLYYGAAGRAARLGRAAVITGATFLGLSSAPLLCLALQGGLLAGDQLTRRLKGRGILAAAILAGLYVGVSLVSSRSPFAIIATGFTLDPWTGFYRLQIWENGLVNVFNNPWLGLGLAEWERPQWMASSSIDAFWLVTMLRAGLPSLALLLTAILLLAGAVAKGRRKVSSKSYARLGTGWLISLIALCLVGCTVHYWNVLHAYFFFFLGLGGWLADQTGAQARDAVPFDHFAGSPFIPTWVPYAAPAHPRKTGAVAPFIGGDQRAHSQGPVLRTRTHERAAMALGQRSA